MSKSPNFRAFTLAEVLITLAIIGIVAAISIPSVISNTQQQEYKTGLRKAVSVLNSAITMNIAMENETPYDNKNLFGYFQRHMAIMKSTKRMDGYFYVTNGQDGDRYVNAAFYTTDGMRYEFRAGNVEAKRPLKLYEDNTVTLCMKGLDGDYTEGCTPCGSLGLNNNYNNTTKAPCLISVDVNGDRKPSPTNVNCKNATCATKNFYKYADPEGLKLTDIFSIMITEKEAIPYGVAAQRAMYQAQAK